jgi:hypothetical protein
MVGYVAGASVNGIRLDSVEIRTSGELDLRGFLGLSEDVAPGYESISYEVTIKGDGTPEQFEEIGLEQPFELRERLFVEDDRVEAVGGDRPFAEAVSNRVRREAGVVLDPGKPFLLRRCDDPTVEREAGGAVVIPGRDA